MAKIDDARELDRQRVIMERRALQARLRSETGDVIRCEWTDKPSALVYIGGYEGAVTPTEDQVKKRGPKKAVEDWAMWKWHTLRGTDVSEQDSYQYEAGYQPPKIEWAAEKVKPGPKPKVAA